MNIILIFLLLLNIKSSTSSVEKYTVAVEIAKKTYNTFTKMFTDCISASMPTMHFEIDDIKKYVNYPSRTTVGFAPKFTSNRKFFANLISTTVFKEMLEKDKDKLMRSHVDKMKYCETTVMDRSLLNEFYDREVDQTVLKMDTIPENEKYYIKTNDGPICGIIEKSEGRQYYKFKSIPYAKPPLGRLRFLPPSPIEKWTEVKDCTQNAPMSVSLDVDENISGSEDCLYIEVSTPNIQPDKYLPVMFWTGCYGFAYVTDHWLDTKLLIDHDVVFVRCGFRLGPFGFLSINDFCAPGNSGLKDIVMALKWVQRNINAFGGDPNNVTLFGNSSGGAIIDFMMMSPMAAGLFHKAIIQSASALNNWSLDKNPSQSVKELAALLGIEKKCNMEIIDELHSVPAKDIIIAFEKMRTVAIDKDVTNFLNSPFKPCIEIEFEGQSSFLSKLPSTILKSGNFAQVPMLIGSTNTEGKLLQFVQQDFYEDFDKFKKTVSLLVHKTLTGDMIYKQTKKDVVKEILKFYLGDEYQLTEHTKSQFIQLISDYFFIYFVNKTVRLHKQYAPEIPLYYYVVNYAGEWTVPRCYEFMNSMSHNAELPLLFEIKMPDQPFVIKGSRDSVRTRSRVIKMWTNFAKYGNPTPDEDDPLLQIKWDPVESANKLNFLNIGSELTKGINPFQERMAFWDKILLKNSLTRTFVYFNDIGMDWW